LSVRRQLAHIQNMERSPVRRIAMNQQSADDRQWAADTAATAIRRRSVRVSRDPRCRTAGEALTRQLLTLRAASVQSVAIDLRQPGSLADADELLHRTSPSWSISATRGRSRPRRELNLALAIGSMRRRDASGTFSLSRQCAGSRTHRSRLRQICSAIPRRHPAESSEGLRTVLHHQGGRHGHRARLPQVYGFPLNRGHGTCKRGARGTTITLVLGERTAVPGWETARPKGRAGRHDPRVRQSQVPVTRAAQAEWLPLAPKRSEALKIAGRRADRLLFSDMSCPTYERHSSCQEETCAMKSRLSTRTATWGGSRGRFPSS